MQCNTVQYNSPRWRLTADQGRSQAVARHASATPFIHSFGHFYSAPSRPLLLSGARDYSKDTVSEFHAEAHRQVQVKDLPKVPTWRLAGVEPTTLRLSAIDSTKAPPCPTVVLRDYIFVTCVLLCDKLVI